MSNEELEKAAREYFESLEDDEDVRTYFKAGAKWAMEQREKEVQELRELLGDTLASYEQYGELPSFLLEKLKAANLPVA